MNVGIVGAGTMGRGVAQVAAENGHLVQLIDISSEALKMRKTKFIIFADSAISRHMTGP